MKMKAQKDTNVLLLIVIGLAVIIASQITGRSVADNPAEYVPDETRSIQVDSPQTTRQPTEDDSINTNQQDSNGMNQQPQPTQTFTPCNRLHSLNELASGNNIGFQTQIATPNIQSRSLREYHIPYYAFDPLSVTATIKTLGIGADGLYHSMDDTGVHHIQTSPQGWRLKFNNIIVLPIPLASWGNRIAYTLVDPSGWIYLFIKETGPDGIFGNPDDLTYIAGAPYNNYNYLVLEVIPNGDVSGPLIDLVPDGLMYPMLLNPLHGQGAFFVWHRPGADGVFQSPAISNPLPVTDDIIQIINPDHPILLTNGIYTASGIQTSISGISGYTVPSGGREITAVYGPGPNGFYESGSSPTFDDERYILTPSSSNANEYMLRIAYDASGMMTVVENPAWTPPPQGTISVNLYDLPTGSQGIINLPSPINVPLMLPSGATGPFDLSLDIEGAFVDKRGLPIRGSFAIAYRFTVNEGGQTRWKAMIYYQDSGPDNQWFTYDDRIGQFIKDNANVIFNVDVIGESIVVNGMLYSLFVTVC